MQPFPIDGAAADENTYIHRPSMQYIGVAIGAGLGLGWVGLELLELELELAVAVVLPMTTTTSRAPSGSGVEGVNNSGTHHPSITNVALMSTASNDNNTYTIRHSPHMVTLQVVATVVQYP